MRRPASLQVDVSTRVDDEPQPTTPASMTNIPLSPATSTTKLPLSSYKPLQPSLTLLFSLMPRRDMFCFFLPAVLVSLISGGVAPFMTIAVGQAFDAFAKFPLSDPTQEDKDKLLRGVGVSALTLLGLAAAALILSSITSSLWIATGERNLRALRRRAYHVITNKEMVWFDQKMGSDDSFKTADSEDGPIGAGGMMAQFVKCAYFILCPSYSKFLTLAQRYRRRPFGVFPRSWVGHSIPDHHSGRPCPRLPGLMVTHPCCFIHLPHSYPPRWALSRAFSEPAHG